VTAVVLQARLDSSRLPKKALLDLGGKPVIFRVMQALDNIPCDLKILACPQDSLGAFSTLADEAGFKVFAGPKDDVLERYCMVIRKYSIDRVIRATGDNPFVFADAACAINSEAASLNADYSGFLNLPYGAGVESVAASALLRAACEAKLQQEREHVCPYLYNHQEIFKIHRPHAPDCWNFPNIRLTIDTQEDYKNASILYAALKNEPLQYNGSTIINTYQNINSKTSGLKKCLEDSKV